MNYLVIDIGGTFIKYAVMDEECGFQSQGKLPTPRVDPKDFENEEKMRRTLDEFIDLLVGLYEDCREEISGIAISAAGVIDVDAGIMFNGGALNYIADLPIVSILQERCGVPVTVENDAKSAGIAEIWRGSLSDCRNAIALIIGTGFGGAVIVDRKVLRGAHFMGGEFSYLFLDAFHAEKMKRTAGQQGMPRLLRRAEKALGRKKGSLTGEELFSLAEEGNKKALRTIRDFARITAVMICNLQVSIDPERIAIGGGVSRQKLLIDMIRDEVRQIREFYPYPTPAPEIVTCKFFNDSNLIGALYSHLNRAKEADGSSTQ